MTNEEVMQAFGIHTCNPAYDRDAEATVEFLKGTIELVNGIRQNKYRWHDLRKITAKMVFRSGIAETGSDTSCSKM